MIQTMVNTARTALRSGNWRIIADKIMARVLHPSDPSELETVRQWCEAHTESYAAWAEAADPELWREALAFSEGLSRRAEAVLANAQTQFGGGGAYSLLYFLTRKYKPAAIIETGVAAGWSSAAFLAALEANGGDGVLWSSDFPYFRQSKAETEIGVLVPAELRHRWRLFVNGDRANLPKIVAEAGPVGLFHYDSDKTQAGRKYGLDLVRPKLAAGALIMFDDIQDNSHFMEFSAGRQTRVFEERGKYIGIAGL